MYVKQQQQQKVKIAISASKVKKSKFVTLSPFPEPTDNASVNFVKYNGDYYVSTETNYMHRVDPDTLESKEKVWTITNL